MPPTDDEITVSTTPSPPKRLSARKRRRSADIEIISNSRVCCPDNYCAGLDAPRRATLFDAYAAGEAEVPTMKRRIASQDDMRDHELIRCFDLLHACGRATDPAYSREATRGSVEMFLEAVFRDWKSGKREELTKPVLLVSVEADVYCGSICGCDPRHIDTALCQASSKCTLNVFAIAKYANEPSGLHLEYATHGPSAETFTDDADLISPVSRPDICWLPAAMWVVPLREALQKKVIEKIHTYNKHLAIWYARRLVQGWAKGLVSGEGERLEFLGVEAARNAVMGLGVV